MADAARARRLAKRIAAIVATELGHGVKDPRLAMITVTAATVTPDLREAVVYYTVYGNELDVESTAAALHSATGVLRSAVGKQTGIKFTPTLAFILDRVPDTARQMDDLLSAARAADAAVAAQAASAAYAGDADPYKVPRVSGDPDDEGDDGVLPDDYTEGAKESDAEQRSMVDSDDGTDHRGPSGAYDDIAARVR
ncbi:30S ribosome-binding factor RbfA [Nakamurella antarctica]|uniref:Ribosome-binding factor A n=1 Tax=Nakamurella antarctica TaxID=1902245 RepID=A0A3G8ZLQ7_9ACTN|nr:30S ribosome-binding factor RbfA [Nakamurella antarctica]AZI58088.1 30S ribosome-binding factor RbfA [Nakamurella antarctica]